MKLVPVFLKYAIPTIWNPLVVDSVTISTHFKKDFFIFYYLNIIVTVVSIFAFNLLTYYTFMEKECDVWLMSSYYILIFSLVIRIFVILPIEIFIIFYKNKPTVYPVIMATGKCLGALCSIGFVGGIAVDNQYFCPTVPGRMIMKMLGNPQFYNRVDYLLWSNQTVFFGNTIPLDLMTNENGVFIREKFIKLSEVEPYASSFEKLESELKLDFLKAGSVTPELMSKDNLEVDVNHNHRARW